MAVYQILEEIMSKRSLSVADIAKMCNLSDSTVRGIVKRKQETIALEVAFKLSDGLNVSLEKLNGMPEKEAGLSYQHKKASSLSDKAKEVAERYSKLDSHGQEAVDVVLEVEYKRYLDSKSSETQMEVAEEIVPDIIEIWFDSLKASAGSGYQLDVDRLTKWKVLLNEHTRKADFCLEVDGRSMEPMIQDGDIILVRQQPAVDIGEIGLFSVNDKGYVKKQGKDRLISINHEFEDISPGEYDQVICRGKVIGVLDPEWVVEK